VLLVVAVYAGALGHPFVFDDRHTVVENPSIHHLDNLRWIFIGSRRFVTNFSFALDWRLWHGSAVGFHATNLLIHAINVIALFALGLQLFDDETPALSAAALFAIHPLLSESVGYVSSRAGMLALTFLLIGTWAYLRAASRPRWLLVTAACLVLGAASKETGLLLWTSCLLIDWLFVRAQEDSTRRRRMLMTHVPVALLVIGFGAWRLFSYRHFEGGFARPPGPQLLTQMEVWWRYLFLWLLPIGQSLVHTVTPVESTHDPRAVVAVASLASALAVLWLVRRSQPVVSFGGLWFLMLLLPSSLVSLSQEMAEHRTYEACAGAALLSVALLQRLGRWQRAAAAALTLALAVSTVMRLHIWATPILLWQDAVAKAPEEWSARYALGDALRESGDCRAAIEAYHAALALRPAELRPRQNLAICLATVGEVDQAAAELAAALHAAPGDSALHYDLALVQLQRNAPESAREELAEALRLRPGYAVACQEWVRQFPREPAPISCPASHEFH
jgi:tetratricopeptide (TPR) repeat protein